MTCAGAIFFKKKMDNPNIPSREFMFWEGDTRPLNMKFEEDTPMFYLLAMAMSLNRPAYTAFIKVIHCAMALSVEAREEQRISSELDSLKKEDIRDDSGNNNFEKMRVVCDKMQTLQQQQSNISASIEKLWNTGMKKSMAALVEDEEEAFADMSTTFERCIKRSSSARPLSVSYTRKEGLNRIVVSLDRNGGRDPAFIVVSDHRQAPPAAIHPSVSSSSEEEMEKSRMPAVVKKTAAPSSRAPKKLPGPAVALRSPEPPPPSSVGPRVMDPPLLDQKCDACVVSPGGRYYHPPKKIGRRHFEHSIVPSIRVPFDHKKELFSELVACRNICFDPVSRHDDACRICDTPVCDSCSICGNWVPRGANNRLSGKFSNMQSHKIYSCPGMTNEGRLEYLKTTPDREFAVYAAEKGRVNMLTGALYSVKDFNIIIGRADKNAPRKRQIKEMHEEEEDDDDDDDDEEDDEENGDRRKVHKA